MNVLLLGCKGDFSDNAGAGIQRYMYELYFTMKELESKSFSVKKKEYRTVQILGNSISAFSQSILDNYANSDIVHNLLPIPIIIKKPWSNNFISIGTAHDFGMFVHPELNEDLTTLREKIWIQNMKLGFNLLLKSDYLITNSTQTRDEAIRFGFLKNKIFVVNLGISKKFISRKRKKELSKRFVVGHISSFRQNKNVTMLINAAKNINDNIDIVLYGKSNPFCDAYFNDATKNKKNIKFCGFAPEDKLVDTYDSFDVFVFPSIYEGFGLPIIEAQSRGIPVIIYKKGDIPKEVRKYCFEAESPEHMAQIIEESKNLYWIDVKNMKKLLESYLLF